MTSDPEDASMADSEEASLSASEEDLPPIKLLDYDKVRAVEMHRPSHITFRISPDCPTSLQPGRGGAHYVRINVRGLGAFELIRPTVLREMRIQGDVRRIEYHREGSIEKHDLEDLFEDSGFLRAMASDDSKHWTLFLNIVGREASEEGPLAWDVKVNVKISNGEWDFQRKFWKDGSVEKEPWDDEGSLLLQTTDLVSELPERLGQLLLERVKARDDQENRQLYYQSAIRVNDALVSLEDNSARIRCLGDLYIDDTSPDERDLEVVVVFGFGSRSTIPDDPNAVYRLTRSPTRDIYRLGNFGEKTKDKSHSTSTEEGANRSRPHSDYALMVFHDTTFKDEWLPISTHVYDFETYCIGDPHHNFIRRDSKGHKYFPPFEALEQSGNINSLRKAVKEYIAQEDPPQIGSGVPFMPTFCFNELNEGLAARLDLGVDIRSWTSEDHIDLAIRCFDHTGEDFTFPQDIAIEQITMTVLPSKILASVEEIILAAEPERKKKKATHASRLFDDDRRETWKMELWIMPQAVHFEPKDRKLYCWVEDAEEEEGELLATFMNQGEWDRRERRLYVEAHFVPRDGESVVVGKEFSMGE